jgi:hypothetical protein
MVLRGKSVGQGGWVRARLCASSECAEVRKRDGVVLLRNSGNPRLVIEFTAEEWEAFTQAVRAGEFDDLPA